jgi:hypothetical protein
VKGDESSPKLSKTKPGERRRKEAQKCHRQRIYGTRFLEAEADEEPVKEYRDVVVLRRLALELEHTRGSKKGGKGEFSVCWKEEYKNRGKFGSKTGCCGRSSW